MRYFEKFKNAAQIIKDYCKAGKYYAEWYDSDNIDIIHNNYVINISLENHETGKELVIMSSHRKNPYEPILKCKIKNTTESLTIFLDNAIELIQNTQKYLETYKHNVDVEMSLIGIQNYKTELTNKM